MSAERSSNGCLNCDGWGCARCRLAEEPGEQGLTADELELVHLRKVPAGIVREIDRRLALHEARLAVMSSEAACGYRLALVELRRAVCEMQR